MQKKPVESSLETAWQLRRDVLPSLSHAPDLVSLALALPCALAAPCASSAAVQTPSSPREAFYSALVAGCSSGTASTVRSLSREPFRSALFGPYFAHRAQSVRWACLEAVRRRLGASSVGDAACRSDPALRMLLAAPYRAALGEGAADVGRLSGVVLEACAEGHACVLGVVFPVARLPLRIASDALLSAAQKGLAEACGLGHDRVVAALLSTRLPLGFDPALRARCLALACDSGRAETVALLARAPMHASGWDARQDRCWSLRTACAQGHARVVALLSRDPFCLGHDEAALNNCEALLLACRNGHADVVRLLGRWPYNLERDDAVRSGALEAAVRERRKAVLQVLQLPPFCFAVDATFGSSEDRQRSGDGLLRRSFTYLRSKAVLVSTRKKSSSGDRRKASADRKKSSSGDRRSSGSSRRPSGSYTYRGRKGVVRSREAAKHKDKAEAQEGGGKVQFWNMKVVKKVSFQTRVKRAVAEFARSVLL
eukprot:m51a1_g10060 hypothetical protein (485) ;mRNA; f:78039-79493